MRTLALVLALACPAICLADLAPIPAEKSVLVDMAAFNRCPPPQQEAPPQIAPPASPPTFVFPDDDEPVVVEADGDLNLAAILAAIGAVGGGVIGYLANKDGDDDEVAPAKEVK